MASYVIESNKLFICCKDTRTLDVYEIDNLHVTPVLEKYWTFLGTVHLGVGEEFEALQIGDRDIIRGRDLKTLMLDLLSLDMTVNCEGFCFLRVSDESKVEYFRMFDLFDWSKYYVKSRMKTGWVRNDIITGRPVLEMSSAKDMELIEIKRLHSGELMEMKRNCSQVIEELKQKHLADLAEFERKKEEQMKAKQEAVETVENELRSLKYVLIVLKQKHLAELAEFERKKEEQLKAKQEALERAEDQLRSLKYELKGYCDGGPSNASFILFYFGLVEQFPAIFMPPEN